MAQIAGDVLHPVRDVGELIGLCPKTTGQVPGTRLAMLREVRAGGSHPARFGGADIWSSAVNWRCDVPTSASVSDLLLILLLMDLIALWSTVAGGVLVLVAQLVTARTQQDVARLQIDFNRWDRWREESAEIWADVLEAVRTVDLEFVRLRELPPDELAATRSGVLEAVHGLDRLSVMALDRRVADWAVTVAGLLRSLAACIPSNPSRGELEDAAEYDELRHLLRERFNWNDGDRSTQLDRLRDALAHATDPPPATRWRFFRRLRRESILRSAGGPGGR